MKLKTAPNEALFLYGCFMDDSLTLELNNRL
ncbi:hypothetical protein Vch1786_I0491 [Vibrio cholerae O1 str. 2010EL-1786]|nr:hypothetical protein VCD_003350 [Vibrio cholerae MJ-1236]AET26100.1 hypothetical protein Vch1786_I0491 [Vibrio cholerae O1 str. 2010EL-1786]EEO09727.1 hypothetical protein VCC_002062 [Vibrio cholerae RC9]EEO15823.1 hypothetical protein VCE_002324 [Vibrio cholerae B33]EEO22553.1 hypothetical protein VCF_000621 [Vibrio cholerae BX 330286]